MQCVTIGGSQNVDGTRDSGHMFLVFVALLVVGSEVQHAWRIGHFLRIPNQHLRELVSPRFMF